CLRCSELSVEDEWCFAIDGDVRMARVESTLAAADSHLLLEAVLAGAGIARLPRVLIDGELRRGVLVEILATYRSPPLGVFALYPERRHLAPKVRLFIDFVVGALPHRVNS